MRRRTATEWLSLPKMPYRCDWLIGNQALYEGVWEINRRNYSGSVSHNSKLATGSRSPAAATVTTPSTSTTTAWASPCRRARPAPSPTPKTPAATPTRAEAPSARSTILPSRSSKIRMESKPPAGNPPLPMRPPAQEAVPTPSRARPVCRTSAWPVRTSTGCRS
jgi:hypothetical protein